VLLRWVRVAFVFEQRERADEFGSGLCGLDYFVDAVFNYPTLAECYKVAALDAANKLSV